MVTVYIKGKRVITISKGKELHPEKQYHLTDAEASMLKKMFADEIVFIEAQPVQVEEKKAFKK